MLHEDDFVDALFAAKDVLWLFRNSDISPEDEDKQAVGDALHALAKVHASIWELKEAREAAEDALACYEQAGVTAGDKSYGLAPAHQTLAGILCQDGDPDGAVQHYQQALAIYEEAGDAAGEAMAKAAFAYQDMMSRLKILDEKPEAFLQAWGDRISANWTLMDEALASMQQTRNTDSEDEIVAMISEMNKKIGDIQKKTGNPTKTVWLYDRTTRKSVRKDYYEPLEETTSQLAVQG